MTPLFWSQAEEDAYYRDLDNMPRSQRLWLLLLIVCLFVGIPLLSWLVGGA